MTTNPSIVHVHPSTLHPNPDDKRDRTTPEYREWEYTLSQDVKERGIKNPILAMRSGDKLVILAGMTRWKAALLAGLQAVPVLVQDRPLTRGEMLLEQLLENELRKGFSDLERAELYAELMQENGWTPAELARALKVSPGHISKVMAVSRRLPEDLRALIGSGEGKLGPSVAYQLSRLNDESEMRALAEKFIKGLLKRDSLEALVSSRLGKRQPKAKPVKVSLPGVTLLIAVADLGKLLSVIELLTGAVRKLERHNLPLASLPQVVKQS